jgi:hypothetical protein
VASKGQGRTKKLPAVLPDGSLSAISSAEAAQISTITSVARLQVDGHTPPDIALALGISAQKVKAALGDPRMRIALIRARAVAAGDMSVAETLALARAEYRLARAWEVLDSEMDAPDPWIRHQAALAVIAAAARDGESKAATEIVVSPDLVFDDQDLQEDGPDGADSGDLMVIDS